MRKAKDYRIGDYLATSGFVIVAVFMAIFGKQALPILIVLSSIPVFIYVPYTLFHELRMTKDERTYTLRRIMGLIMIFFFSLCICILNMQEFLYLMGSFFKSTFR